MVRALNRLSAREVATLKKPGRHFDGGGLCLFISPDSSRRRWTFQFRWQGRKCEMGLGLPGTVPLAKARELAAMARLTVQNGGSPLEEKRAALDAQRRSADEQQQSRSKARTFGQVADDLIQSKGAAWRNAKHRAQWSMTLEIYAASLRALPVTEVTTEHILAALQPIWTSKDAHKDK